MPHVAARSAGSTVTEDIISADYCAAIEKAILKTMEIFGEDYAKATVMMLKNRYRIRLGSAPFSSIEDIERVLAEITGTGADMIISRMRLFLC